jgi:hypothetical protein
VDSTFIPSASVSGVNVLLLLLLLLRVLVHQELLARPADSRGRKKMMIVLQQQQQHHRTTNDEPPSMRKDTSTWDVYKVNRHSEIRARITIVPGATTAAAVDTITMAASVRVLGTSTRDDHVLICLELRGITRKCPDYVLCDDEDDRRIIQDERTREIRLCCHDKYVYS